MINLTLHNSVIATTGLNCKSKQWLGAHREGRRRFHDKSFHFCCDKRSGKKHKNKGSRRKVRKGNDKNPNFTSKTDSSIGVQRIATFAKGSACLLRTKNQITVRFLRIMVSITVWTSWYLNWTKTYKLLTCYATLMSKHGRISMSANGRCCVVREWVILSLTQLRR